MKDEEFFDYNVYVKIPKKTIIMEVNIEKITKWKPKTIIVDEDTNTLE